MSQPNKRKHKLNYLQIISDLSTLSTQRVNDETQRLSTCGTESDNQLFSFNKLFQFLFPNKMKKD